MPLYTKPGTLLAFLILISVALHLRLVKFVHFQERNIIEHHDDHQHHHHLLRITPSSSSVHQSQRTRHSSASLLILIPDRPDPSVLNNLKLAWLSENKSDLCPNDPYLLPIRSGSCPPTSQFLLEISNNEDDHWRLISLDFKGTKKVVGGDEVYITYHHRNVTSTIAPTAVAHSLDQGNGTYLLEFKHPPLYRDHSTSFRTNTATTSVGGMLKIHLQYTCGLGQLEYPYKEAWRSGGSPMTEYKKYVPMSPKIEPFLPPNLDGTVDLEKYHKVIIYGDSNLQTMYRSNGNFLPNLKFGSKPDSPLYPQSMKKRFLPKIIGHINETLQKDIHRTKHRYALMLGSACWDLVFPNRNGEGFKNHLTAVRGLLETLKLHYGPEVDIFWHSGFALQLHVAGHKGWEDRKPLKYMSYHRSFLLYQKQKDLIQEIGNITLLDFMEGSFLSASSYVRTDARHITKTLARRLMFYYYPKRKFEMIMKAQQKMA